MKRLLLLAVAGLMISCNLSCRRQSSESPNASLLSFTIPSGSEVYLASDSVYAEIKGVDLTAVIFEEEIAELAIAQFREAREKQAVHTQLVVSGIEEREILGLPSVVIDYEKPAKVAALDENGEIKAVRALERTRQVYLDFGIESLVLTTWTKKKGADIEAVAEAILTSLQAGNSLRDGRTRLAFRSGGAGLDDLAESFVDNVLTAPLRIDVERKR